jgi:DNA invertase Pin-like site-specific DNA recombinase
VLVIAKRDRLARDIVVALTIERLVERVGARVASADGTTNAAGPEGDLMRGIVDLFAGYERSLIRARTKAALAVKRSRGERTGYVGFGFKLDHDGLHIVENIAEQAIIAEIQAMSAAGLSSRRIAARLTELGRPARGSRWHPTTVLELLRRRR